MSASEPHVRAAQRQRYLVAANECTGFGVRKAARALSRIYDEALAPAGLRGTQFNLLVALSLAGEAPVAKVADELGLDRTTLTRNLAPLERDGLVKSVADADRRVRRLRLTERGHEVLADALPRWERAQRQVVAALGKARWRELMDGLRAAANLPDRL
jgi:DNA-binding MarR family transcriptional regulator